MNQVTHYLHLHKEYLFGMSEQTRPGELDHFETLHLDFYDWLQKEQGLSPEQEQAVINDSCTVEEN